MLVEYFGNSDFAGDPIAVQHGDDFRMQYLGPAGPGIPYPEFWARASATFTASTPGRHEFVLGSNALARLLIDGRAVGDLGGEDDSDWFGSVRELRWEVDLDEDEPVDLAVEFATPALRHLQPYQPRLSASRRVQTRSNAPCERPATLSTSW